MFEHIGTIFPASIFLVIESLIISWLILKFICLASPDFFSFLYISSGKSTTNARLLGGLAISSALLCGLTIITFIYPKTITLIEKKTLAAALISIFLITFYGYVDDKFEVRVRFKLTLQLLSVFNFSYLNANNISPEYPVVAFIASSVLGLALINGANLLDGLDTLSIKLGISSSFAFLYLGIFSHSSASTFLSIIMISSLCMFYFFNREPAKVYMGEIGGSIIGLVYYIQSSTCFSALKTRVSMSEAFALVFMAGCFPVFELGISFLRRILSKRSPFCGDKLHLHYILKNKYNLSASAVSSRMGISSLLILGFGFLVARSYSPIFALAIVTFITLKLYILICLSEWKSSHSSHNLDLVFKLFEGKTITIIDSTEYESLDITSTHTENKKKSKSKKSA